MDIKVIIDISPESANNLAAAFSKIGLGGSTVQGAQTITEGSTGTAKAEKPATKPAKAEKPAAPAVTLDDLKAAATLCVSTPAKKAKLVELNKETFKVGKISELKPEQYADALKAYKALAAEAEEEDPTA